MTFARWVAAIAAAAFAFGMIGILAVGEMLSRPTHNAIGRPPSSLDIETVQFRTSAEGNELGQLVSGWLLRGRPHNGVILLLHGVHADRRAMTGRARFLHESGYSVLLIDLPAHGESEGDRITFGYKESTGVDGALSFLARHFPGEKVGVIGVSLGAASLVMSHPTRTPDAVVLESMYPTIEDAVANRLTLRAGQMAWAGELLAPILVSQLPWRLGVSARQLRPIDSIVTLRSPVFIISGSADMHTTQVETRRIFSAAPEPRQLWIVDGAAHVDLHAFARAEYEQKVGAFLGKYLQQTH